LKQILISRSVDFNPDDGISQLRKLLRSHVKQLRKIKLPEWSKNTIFEEQRKHDKKLDDICRNWPQSASMELKEQCIRNFRAATSSESLRQFTCACCAESVNILERNVLPIREIDLDLMRDHTDRIFD
jgi:hypothetical protein